MENLKNTLKKLGFNEKEVLVYLATLHVGSGSNAAISRESRLNRITNYEVLKRLIEKSVVSKFKMRGIWYFSALSPQTLLKQFRESLTELENNVKEIDLNIFAGKKPTVCYFSKKEGLKNIYRESLACEKKEILTFTNPTDIRNYFGNNFIDSYVAERVQKKIKVRGFAPNNTLGIQEKETGINLLRETILFDQQFNILNEIMIFDDKIALFSIKDEIGLIIKSHSIAETLKNIWLMLYEKNNTK